MTSVEPARLVTAAARNNAAWCAAVCRSHGVHGTLEPSRWWAARRTPPYYPDAVVLRPDAAPAGVVAGLDTATPGCSVKDSFATLDLAPHGFAPLLTARWIHRPTGPPAPASGPRAEPVRTPDGLRDWQAAWHGGAGPDVFRPGLLADPAVLVLAVREERHAGPIGGAVLNQAAGLVGVSNVFTVGAADPAAVWSAVLTAAAGHFAGLDLVGYEQDDDLPAALAAGFTTLGPLRVWLHG